MMFYFPWLLLILISVATALGAFVWALANGQFSDQERARFLPLRGMIEAEEAGTGNPRRLLLVSATLVAMVLVMMAAVLFIVLTHS